MRAAEFKATKGLVESWRGYVQNDETIKSVLSVIEDESPLRDPNVCTEADPLIRYGFALGYTHCADKYKELTILPPVANDPTKKPSTYGVKKKQNA